MSPRFAAPLRLLVLLVALAALGCVSTGRVQLRIEDRIRAGDYAGAVEAVDLERNGAYRGRNRLLYFLERGMLLHLDGRHAESNASFAAAKELGRVLRARSLSRESVSLMTNDYALEYAGEHFERTLIHLFSALNYEQQGDFEAALVEIRQLRETLLRLEQDAGGDQTYRDDAFARYLSALFHEQSGDHDAALVDYKLALSAYEAYGDDYGVDRPGSLFVNAERVAARLGGWAQDDLERLGSTGLQRDVPEGHGELVLLHYNGLSPIKSQTRIAIPFSEAWLFVAAVQAGVDDYTRESIQRAMLFHGAIRGLDLVSVAFPKFVPRRYAITSMEPRAARATRMTGPELVEDIGAIAVRDLEDRKTRIYAKAIARAAIKYAIQRGLMRAAREARDGEGGDLLVVGTQILGNFARFASEQADRRVWSSLPDEIWMSQMILPAGRHDVEVDFLDAREEVVETRFLPEVEIAAGERRFVVLRTVR